jgi:hypothetical protein
MDKLYFYMLQTDIMLPKWLGELDKHKSNFLTSSRPGSLVTFNWPETVVAVITMIIMMMGAMSKPKRNQV